MNKDKQARLEAHGWRVGSAEDFLGQRPRATRKRVRPSVRRHRMSAYHVTYERDESGWWVASVRELRGCLTQGQTVDEARCRIRKAMELFVDDARSANLVDNVKLPATALRRQKRASNR